MDSEEIEAAEAAEAAEAWVRVRSQLVSARAGALEGGRAHNRSEADALLRKYNRHCAAALAPRSEGQKPVASANLGEPKASSSKKRSANPCCTAGSGCSGEYVPAVVRFGTVTQVTIVCLKVSAG